MDWKEFIQQYSNKQIKKTFPLISARLPYSWRSGEREPPKYVQEALRDVLIKKNKKR